MTTAGAAPRIAVIGGGITGLTAAYHVATVDQNAIDAIVLFERSGRVGGRLSSSPFAGVASVDEGADAFLARVPDAHDLAVEVGLGNELVHPEPVGAAVWYDGLHDIPDGLVLGVPGNPISLAKSGLLSARGVARAALEPFIPRTSTDPDSIGHHIRARFGNEVHERLVDALVGSIYATDTDRFSLAEVPQLAALANERSMLLGARQISSRTPGTASAAAGPIFSSPRGGMQQLADATHRAFVAAGGTVMLGAETEVSQADDGSWHVDDQRFDAVILAVPATAASELIDRLDADLSRSLARAETADVVMVTMHIDAAEFPDRLRGRSGYLVPKPVQQAVTAASFGSQKWAHWAPPRGGEIVRVSLGRDGSPVLNLSDDEIVERMAADLQRQLGVGWSPLEMRITRWPGAFAQYRPHHGRWVSEVRNALPGGLHVAGSSFDGIGVPACVRSGKTIAERALAEVNSLPS